MSLFAQFNFDDWIQFAVIAVIIVGSVIANVVKSLTKRGEESREKRGIPPIAPPPMRRGDLPTAKPMPPRPTRRDASGPVLAQEPRPVPPRPPRVYKVPPPLAQPARPATAETRPRAEPRPTPPPPKRPRLAPAQSVADSETQPQQRREVVETMADHRRRMGEDSDKRIGHVDEGVVPSIREEDIDVLPDDQEIWGFKLPAAQRFPLKTLRSGIVLSEILGPPVSLRPLD